MPRAEKRRSFFSNLKLKKKKVVQFDDAALVDVLYISSSSLSTELDMDDLSPLDMASLDMTSRELELELGEIPGFIILVVH